MIGSPDLVAFTQEDDFGESPDPSLLPEEFSVPLFNHTASTNPWTKTSYAKFSKDFILISEFSEQVGPQPLLTIPSDPKVCGTFDLNYFSLRIMSVDYQASFVGHPPGSNYPKLNFVEDSKVVLVDSKEGAFAYVHHLTLYDLEARGFVRPFCMAYISADEKKIMQQFQELSSEFSKASEMLKSGNRTAFANELEKKLKDLEYTRSVLHKETELQKINNGCYSTQAIEKANELANVEKSMYEHKDLLRQITSYPFRKKKDKDFVQSETEKQADTSSADNPPTSKHSDNAVKSVNETESENRKSSYTPQFIKAKSAKCFDKRLKTLEELCETNFFHQTLEQLNLLEKSFRGDLCFIYTSQITRALLTKQRVTSFLFEPEADWKEETSKNFSISPNNFPVPILNLSGERMSLESYTTCEDVDHVKPSVEGPPESSTSDITQETSEAADTETKGSFGSDKSIEAFVSVSPSNIQSNFFDAIERNKMSIASSSENQKVTNTPHRTSHGSPSEVFRTENLVPIDTACCIGQEGFIYEEPSPELAQECCGDTVVNQEPLSFLQGDPALQMDFILEDSSPNTGLIFPELNTSVLSEEVARINIEDVADNMSYMSTSTSSDRAASPFTYGSALTIKQKKKAGHSALRFIRQYPFAQQAIFCLLSGRTLIILGTDEGTVRKLINALFIFVPNLGKYGESVQPWLCSPFQLTDLQRWKLIGLQRAASPAGSNILHSLNRYSRYISILDCDNKTLRCPPHKGTLISHLADHRTQIKRGSTYFLHVQSMLTQLTAKAFLYTFCHHVHLPMDITDQGSVTSRRTNFLLQLGYTVEESKIVQYLSELIKQHYIIQGPSKGVNQSYFTFNYTTSYLYKI